MNFIYNVNLFQGEPGEDGDQGPIGDTVSENLQ